MTVNKGGKIILSIGAALIVLGIALSIRGYVKTKAFVKTKGVITSVTTRPATCTSRSGLSGGRGGNENCKEYTTVIKYSDAAGNQHFFTDVTINLKPRTELRSGVGGSADLIYDPKNPEYAMLDMSFYRWEYYLFFFSGLGVFLVLYGGLSTFAKDVSEEPARAGK